MNHREIVVGTDEWVIWSSKIPRLPNAALRCVPRAKEAAEKGRISGEDLEKHTAGAEARFDSIAFMPGINPRHTARRSFSAACKARSSFYGS